jgi:hypothetical protein
MSTSVLDKAAAPQKRAPRGIAGRFCVLVNSSDRARDIFEIVYANSEATWRACEWPRYVGFTTRHPDMYGFTAIAAKGPAGWREELAAQLDALPAEIDYVLRLEEDMLFLSPVDGAKLNAIAALMVRDDLVYVNLSPLPSSLFGGAVEVWRKRLSRRPLRPLSFSQPYYTSLTPAIWKRSYLRDLLRRPGNVWEFEHIVTDRRHYAVWEPVLDFDAIVSKGKWLPRARQVLARQGLSLADSQREFQAAGSRLRGLRQRITFALVGYLGLRIRRKLNMLPHIPKELTKDQFEPVGEGQSQ